MLIENDRDFLERNRTHKVKVEALQKRLKELYEMRKPLDKEIKKLQKEIIALNREKNRLNKERSEAIKRISSYSKDKAAHTWFAVGVQEGENLRSCGFEYYQTKEECQLELEWFRYTYPERRFKIALVIRDDINEKEAARK